MDVDGRETPSRAGSVKIYDWNTAFGAIGATDSVLVANWRAFVVSWIVVFIAFKAQV
jgi:hypothetical protein